MKNMGCYIWY